MPTSNLSAVVTREDDHYVALCVEFDMASQGKTVDDAVANLRKAVELYLSTADDDEVARRHRVVVLRSFEVCSGARVRSV